MTSSAAVAVAQFAPTADREANLTAIADLANRAADRGASLVVFPEYSSFFTPEMGPDWVAAAEPVDGRFVQGLASIAVSRGIHVVAGFLEEAEHSRAANTVVAIDPEGAVVARYRKIHLYDAFGSSESEWIVPGEIAAPETFEWSGFTVGLQTCYDLRFPEVSRRLVDAGVDLMVVPSEWVRGPLKEHHWRTLLTARAIENTVFVAAADHAPPIGVGNSMILDPAGVAIATVGDNTDVGVGFVSLERVREVRKINPALELRRFKIRERTVSAEADAE